MLYDNDDESLVRTTGKIWSLTRFGTRKYPGRKLIPEDPVAYGRFEQACSMEQSYFAAAAETIGTELYIRPYVKLSGITRTRYRTWR